MKNCAVTLPLTSIDPVNSEPLSALSTLNPLSGDTDAVTEPDLISVEMSASSVKADLGMLNNCSPLPLKKLPDERNTLPLNMEPLNTEVTTNPNSSLTEAVTLPLDIIVEIKASSANAALGISNNPSPLPLKKLPDAATKFPPVMNKLPVNCAGPIFLNVLDEDIISEPVIVTLPSISVSPIIFTPVLTGTWLPASTMLIVPNIDECNWQL